MGEFLCAEAIIPDIVSVEEFSGGSTVYKGIKRLFLSSVGGFKFDFNLEGGRTVVGGYDKFFRQPSFPLWTFNPRSVYLPDFGVWYQILHVFGLFNCFIYWFYG
jgi:hypothetical protein